MARNGASRIRSVKFAVRNELAIVRGAGSGNLRADRFNGTSVPGYDYVWGKYPPGRSQWGPEYTDPQLAGTYRVVILLIRSLESAN